MKEGDLVSMRSGSPDPQIGLIIHVQQKDGWDDDNNFSDEWCTVIWDDGDLTQGWGDELAEVLCKTKMDVI